MHGNTLIKLYAYLEALVLNSAYVHVALYLLTLANWLVNSVNGEGDGTLS